MNLCHIKEIIEEIPNALKRIWKLLECLTLCLTLINNYCTNEQIICVFFYLKVQVLVLFPGLVQFIYETDF